MNPEYISQIKQALNDAANHAGVPSANALARRLDVTKQALSKWKRTGVVPAHRACQIELLTQGKVGWRDLCPDIVDDFNALPDVKPISRN
jgi:DNA-binding transcriptional regulator YdaS (Cro superfamily)|tara:strand:+ start:325 stop:594 length:270 start_codon:yes stop_codon:yes gene_type:complete